MLVWLFVLCVFGANGKLDEDEDQGSSGDHDLGESLERIGAMVTQVYEHPYAASLNKNDTYVCSAIVLNKHWLLTMSKCFDSNIITSYVTHKNLNNFTVRAGSSYNNKGGALFKIKMLINNFDIHVSAIKLEKPMVFSSQIQSVRLPGADDDISLGYLTSIIAWTPNGHMRVVNAPVIDPTICESDTKMLPGHYICVGGVQDPNRHFCRKDNGGAVVQNGTLIAISSFINICAFYAKTHAFPKISNFVRWIDTIIWDEETSPTTKEPSTTTEIKKSPPNATQEAQTSGYYENLGKYMITLPFDPINVPLEPAENNSVLPGMSLYESYLQSMAKAKALTAPKVSESKDPVTQKTQSRKPNKTQAVSQFLYGRLPQKYDRVWY